MSDALTWSSECAGEALFRLAEAAGLAPRSAELGAPSGELVTWLDEAARWIGVEIDAVAAPVSRVEAMIEGAAPALLRTPSGVVAVLAVRRRHAVVLTPDLGRTRVAVAALAEALVAPRSAPIRAAIATQLDRLELRGAAARRAASALVAARMRGTEIDGVIAVRLAPDAPLRTHASARALGPRIAVVATAHVGSYVLALASWWAIGRAALAGRVDSGTLAAWALCLLSAVAVRAGGTWAVGRLSIDASTLIKQRLLAGALRADLDTLRADGVGRSLGRVFEATAVEQLAIGGGVLALFAAIELAVAAVVVAFGAGGFTELGLLAATLVATAVILRRYLGRRRAWTERRLEITHQLVESMVGHATRLAQQPAERRHADEDRALATYTAEAAAMDGALVGLQALVPRGWLVIALAGLTPVIVANGTSSSGLALALGGALLAYSALSKLTTGMAQLAGAAIAWRAIEPLLTAGGRAPAASPPAVALAPPSPSAPIASLQNVVYRPQGRVHPVLDGCDLAIEPGARILLEGSSGAGKSTLAAMVAGLRRPDGGLVLAGGLDRVSLGERGWRRRVACAPQFHDNHLFSATLAFNVLLARAWPPRREDLADAHAVCRELGLGDMLARMPNGLFEMVGETGWQLSHGERSRVYLARALLQRAPLVVLDESLAALDSGTLRLALACIERRAGAALVIAHP